MDNCHDERSWERKRPMGFLAGLRIVKSLLSRLVSLMKVTEQDLDDAGVFLR